MARKQHFLTGILCVAVLAACLVPAAGLAGDVDQAALKAAIDKYLSDIDQKKFYQITPKVVNTQRQVRPNLILLDVRKPEEVKKLGIIPGAKNIRLNSLMKSLDQLPSKKAPIIIYCKGGARGTMAVGFLGLMGYTDVKNMKGGFTAWTKASFPVEKK